ncbi:UNKNOWN [Stylonychia lemnae]|uniref:Uncharacterized protein n=1 Tax=Stylonychia lemnae TaxID=5949 RepID=A0A078AJN0_STYLE|nr:UNKNOWN [Stylonychia lemnae]|eukprot:CDW82580.1 UNKNOWN [Stylonychia lemnae]
MRAANNNRGQPAAARGRGGNVQARGLPNQARGGLAGVAQNAARINPLVNRGGLQNQRGAHQVNRGRGGTLSFASAYGNMMDLISEYHEAGQTGMENLTKKGILETSNDLFTFIATKNIDRFNQIVGQLEECLAQERLNGPQNQQPQEYGEEEEKEEGKFSPEQLKVPSKFIQALSAKSKDGKGNLLDFAITETIKHKDTRFIKRLLDIGFPLYKYNGESQIWKITQNTDNQLFESVLMMFIKAGFNIQKPIREDGLSFIDILFSSHVNEQRINQALTYLKREITEDERNQLIETLEKNHLVAIADKKKVLLKFCQRVYLDQAGSILFTIHLLQRKKIPNKLATLRDHILREVVKYL